MRIDQNTLIAGQKAIYVRKFLLKARSYAAFYPYLAEKVLSLSSETTILFLEELEKLGYIEQYGQQSNENEVAWVVTLKGNTFANASAAKPAKRTTADQLITQLLDRIEYVNSNDEFLWSVEKVVLFGSYLTESPRVNDIDLAISLTRKHPPALQEKLERNRIRSAKHQGKRFSNISDELGWPYTEVMFFLQSRSHILKFHILEQHKDFLFERDTKLLFEVKQPET